MKKQKSIYIVSRYYVRPIIAERLHGADMPLFFQLDGADMPKFEIMWGIYMGHT